MAYCRARDVSRQSVDGKQMGEGIGEGRGKDDESGRGVERESGRSQRDLAALVHWLTNTRTRHQAGSVMTQPGVCHMRGVVI